MITIKSHGFKYSRPEANIYFDVSYFANPWRVDEIRKEEDAGKRKALVADFMKQNGVGAIVWKIADLLEAYNESFPDENIQVAICCSAGEYRSPAIAEMIVQILENRKIECILENNKNSKI